MQKPVIICVDDEPLILQSMRLELQDAFGNEYAIEVCESGNEAIALIDELEEDNIDIPLVIVDYLLPDIQGDELLKRIQELLPRTRKIMLTGVGDVDEVAKAIQSVELYSYISKPWENLALIFTAKGALKNYHQEESLNKKTEELQQLNKSLEQRVQKRTKKLADLVLLRDKILSIVGHDIRTPLASLQSSLILINRNMVSEEEGKSLLNEIGIKMGSTLSLVENLLSWASQQMGGLQTNVKVFPFNSVLEDVLDVISPIAQDKKIEIIREVNDFTIKADYEHTHLVLRNLLSNAIKFTDSGGKISIKSNIIDSFISISIVDNGVGMSEKIVKSLFQSEKIESQLGTKNETGTGLGLMLCHEFIKMNGGEITVQSQVGEGSNFTFTLPLAQD